MAHTLKLGYKDDPTVGTDDAIDLGDPTSGYGLVNSPSIGEPYTNEYGTLVRQITIPLEVAGSTNDIAMSRVRKINRYIERTNLFFDYYKGQYPGRAVTTSELFAGILTFKARTATKKVYWNIFSGTLSAGQPLQDELLTNSIIQATLTLVVEAAARGERVQLKNLVPMGDFGPPFNISATFPTLAGGWAFTGTWTAYANTTTEYPFLTQSIKSTAASSTATITVTNASSTYFSNGDYVLPQFYYKINTITASSLSIVFQTFDGASWTTRQSTTAAATTAHWVEWSGTAYQVPLGTTQLRLVATMPTSGTVDISISGAAIWLLSSSSQAAPVEYMTYGGKVGLPNITVYNIQGDVPAPCVLHMENRSGVLLQGLFMGQHAMYTFKDYPIFELDYRTSTSTTAATTLFWDNLPVTSSAAASSSTYGISATTAQPAGNNTNGHYLDQAMRTYRAYLVYAANDSAAITSCSISLAGQTRTYNVAVPRTYTGTANAAAGDFRLFDLGDFVFTRPGLASLNQTINEGDGLFGGSTQVTLYHSTSANRRTSVAGVFLMPVVDGAAYVNFGSSGNGYQDSQRINFDTEGSAPRITLDYINPGSYVVPVPLQTYNPLAVGTFSGFYLVPELTDDGLSNLQKGRSTVNRFSVLIISGLSGALIDNDRQYQFTSAQYGYFCWLEYSPRYLYGFNA